MLLLLLLIRFLLFLLLLWLLPLLSPEPLLLSLPLLRLPLLLPVRSSLGERCRTGRRGGAGMGEVQTLQRQGTVAGMRCSTLCSLEVPWRRALWQVGRPLWVKGPFKGVVKRSCWGFREWKAWVSLCKPCSGGDLPRMVSY